MRVLDLFSGIGGFSLGLERAGMTTVAFCEIDPFCRQVLAKHWPDVPIHEDIRELTADAVGPVDLVCGGYPCQPFSLAGQRKGEEDDRHLWPEMHRLVDALRPAWVCGENVAGHIGMGLDRVLSDLEASGYSSRTFAIPACAVDAPHRRERVWIVANCNHGSRAAQQEGSERDKRGWAGDGGQGDMGNAARTETKRQRRHGGQALRDEAAGLHREPGVWHDAEWISGPDGSARRVKPGVRLLAHGISGRVSRLRALGNAVVPQIPEMIGHAIMEAEGMGA